MEAQDPLKDLADIHLPDPVSLWPLALGWWVLAAFALALLVYAGLRYAIHWRGQQRLKAALRELDGAYHRYQQTARSQGLGGNAAGLEFLHGCNAVLKRVALLHHPAPVVARLHGEAWLGFLDSRGNTHDFSTGSGRILGDGGYRPTFNGDAAALHTLCARWVRHAYRSTDRSTDRSTGRANGAQVSP
ncbi:MAG: DUF4381 domain-containing protein [Pseudomonadales bacterium]|jgi:hypothetical protein|nr:DUF4381 domain-containing protein [Pseudomonadales bacterium]